MLPVSAADTFPFYPVRERVEAAKKALEEATSEKPANKIKAAAAKSELAAAEKAIGEGDPCFNLRVPSERTKARVNHDLICEGIYLRGNADLVDAILANLHDVSPADGEYVTQLRQGMSDAAKAGKSEDFLEPHDWEKVHVIARSIPAAARIIADRILHTTLYREHMIRHHLIIDGKPSPLRESDFEEFVRTNPLFVPAIGDKIAEMTILPPAIAKN